jgi:hypothetical protein
MKIRQNDSGDVYIINGGDLSHIKFRYLDSLMIIPEKVLKSILYFEKHRLFKGKLCNVKSLVICNTVVKPMIILDYYGVRENKFIECDYTFLHAFNVRKMPSKISKYCTEVIINYPFIKSLKSLSKYKTEHENAYYIKDYSYIPIPCKNKFLQKL